MNKKILILGNPENRRNKFFIKALEKNKLEYKIISYLDILNKEKDIGDYLEDNMIFRIESPGENFEVEKKLINLEIKEEFGRINFPKLWYEGYSKLLKEIEDKVKLSNKKIYYMNTPNDIKVMFDKSFCQNLLLKNNINIPIFYDNIFSYKELKELMFSKKLRGIFIKLNYSSSASGIGAYRINYRTGQEVFYSTIKLKRENGEFKFYNSLKIIRYTESKDIKTIVDWLIKETCQIEEWIGKASYEDKSYDVRVFTAGNKAYQSVVRMGKSPMTNLHLGNERSSLYKINLKEEEINNILNTAETVKNIFKGSIYAGIDVMYGRDKKTYVSDVNAFGDLLPKLLYQEKSTYEIEIDVLKERLGEKNCII